MLFYNTIDKISNIVYADNVKPKRASFVPGSRHCKEVVTNRKATPQGAS